MTDAMFELAERNRAEILFILKKKAHPIEDVPRHLNNNNKAILNRTSQDTTP